VREHDFPIFQQMVDLQRLNVARCKIPENTLAKFKSERANVYVKWEN
jgi:hypothetical protein